MLYNSRAGVGAGVCFNLGLAGTTGAWFTLVRPVLTDQTYHYQVNYAEVAQSVVPNTFQCNTYAYTGIDRNPTLHALQ